MDDSKNEQVPPLTDAAIREIYIRGLLRNLMSVINRTFGDATNKFFAGETEESNSSTASVTGGNKDRGDCSFDMLVYLFSRKRLMDLATCLLRTMKNSKQGNATYHELGLSHCLLCVLQHLQHGKHDRHADAITTSMTMGRIIGPLSNLTAKAIETFGLEQIGELTADQIEQKFPDDWAAVQTAVEKAKRLNKKSKRLEKLNLSCDRLILAFALLALSGIHEQQPFESFLK